MDAVGVSDEPDPRRWRILAVTLLVGFMSLLDVTIVNVAIPSMRAGLDTTAGTVQWVVSGYALAFGLTLVAGGRLGDAHGRRRMMLIGLSGFIVSSAAVGLAPNIEMVIVARLAQGATAGLLTPQNTGLIQQLFRGAERGRAFGFFGLTVSISSGIGPVLGGLILALAGEEMVGASSSSSTSRSAWSRWSRSPGWCPAPPPSPIATPGSTWWARPCSASECCRCCSRW